MDHFGEEEIEFPVEVHFRIICDSSLKVATHVRIAAEDLGLGDRLKNGNESSSGKYLSYQLSTVVGSKEEMTRIDQAFRSVDGVKMVL